MGRILALVLAFGMVAALPGQAQDYALIHGNYCGFRKAPGPEGSDLPPVDVLDAICMRHDQCYDLRGNFECSCDLALMREISALRWAEGRSVRLARAVFYGIAALPCSDVQGQLRKIEMARATDM